jgi:hypothetical protein
MLGSLQRNISHMTNYTAKTLGPQTSALFVELNEKNKRCCHGNSS